MLRLIALCALLFVPLATLAATVSARPNIIVIVADDLGYADVLFNPLHPKEVTTPHLDSLARESVICRQGYVSGHVCSPTRAGLMTGRYQQRCGLYTAGEAGSGLPMVETIFPQFLKPAGYATAQFGKWHLGPDLSWSPALRGFDEVFGFLGRGAHDYFKLDDPNDPIYRGTTIVHEKGYLTDRLGEETVSFITQHKDQPFFVYLAFNAVHAPLQAPEDEIAKFNTGNMDRNTLLAMGKRLDDAVGQVVAHLKSQGLWDNTLIFFISDNGGPLPETAVNTPLRGGKHQDFEGGIRVPFLVCWPSKLKPGESQAVVSSLDILPTALAAAGVALPTEKPLDGLDLMPILRQEAPAPTRNLFWASGSVEGWWGVRSGDWKLVAQRDTINLFDLGKDVSEKTDLAKQMPEKIAELTKLHDAWLAEMLPPVGGEGKRFGMEVDPNVKQKKPKSERKKNKKPEVPAAAAEASSSTSGEIHESFASLPAKPWKTQRGGWEAKDNALWVSPKPGGAQEALLRGPTNFHNGVMSVDLYLGANSKFYLRLRDPDDDGLIRLDITPEEVTVNKLTGERHEVLTKVALKPGPAGWHKLTLKFDGPELYGELDDAIIIVADSILERDKSEVDFLVSAGTVGLRKFSVVPTAGEGVPRVSGIGD